MADHDATPSSHFTYHVFLSFRGYTRFGFTDCLYSALNNKGINTFRDNENLIVGDEIRPTIVEAIEKSRMSIVVLCEEYASSSWCLDELVKIMECSENGRKRPVLPIFYKVDPSDVRHQSNQYGTAMIQLENRFGKDSHKVKAWRSALFSVCELTGQHCTKDMYESRIINKIVEVVLKKLPHVEHPVRLDSQLEEVESLLDIESRDTCSIVKGNKRRKDIGEEHVVGLDNSFNIILTQLKKEDSCRNIISVIGMGGLGKTTLAKKIYFNNEIKKLFPCRAWASVSHDYRISGVLSSLLHDLKPSALKNKTPSEKEMEDELGKHLEKNKYLIVLDDIWEPEVWDDMIDVFPDDNNGSRILITSRNKEVANYPNSSYIHHLPFLDENESWKLFCKKVFWGKKCPDNLKDIGRSIAERCEGLPITIITLGGLLARKRSRREWLLIRDVVPWHSAQDKENVMNVLELSYKNLPKKLKHCFLYFGMFPEDCEISARELIQLWVVEGFIQLEETGASSAPEPEDVADSYLDELVDRSLVQVTRRRSDGGVKECKIHDLFRQLCISVSKAENFLEIRTGYSSRHIASNPDGLPLLSNTESYLSAVKTNESCTHSLFIFDGNEHSNDTLENFRSVHVLRFGNDAHLKLTASYLETMTSLRYLGIGKSMTHRPSNHPIYVWSPLNIETVCVKDWFFPIIRIPGGIWKLENLRHFCVRSLPVRLLFDQREAESSKPMHKLQTISMVAFDQPMSILISRGIFPNLKKLGLRCVKLEECLPEPTKKTKKVQEDPNSLYEQLQSLQHLTNLRTLKIHFRRRKVSLDAILFPSSLAKINLAVFRDLTIGSINNLGQLPNLQCLKLRHTGMLSLICSAGKFPQLQVLRMERTFVESWILEEGAMPCLQSLVVKECLRLNELPEQLWSLTTLQQVHVANPTNALRKSILPYLEFKNDCKITIEDYPPMPFLLWA